MFLWLSPDSTVGGRLPPATPSLYKSTFLLGSLVLALDLPSALTAVYQSIWYIYLYGYRPSPLRKPHEGRTCCLFSSCSIPGASNKPRTWQASQMLTRCHQANVRKGTSVSPGLPGASHKSRVGTVSAVPRGRCYFRNLNVCPQAHVMFWSPSQGSFPTDFTGPCPSLSKFSLAQGLHRHSARRFKLREGKPPRRGRGHGQTYG